MAVHFFHTSDWHLGQLFFNHSRQYEHEQFLAWLLQCIQDKQPHALLIAGDVFDVINPSSSAQKQLYQFLADAHQCAPHMQTLIIAGNHDSGYRLEQVEPLLEKYNAKTVGIVRWHEDKTLDISRLILPIYDQEQTIIAWCIALPFLRAAEITGLNEHTTTNQNAIAYLHQHLISEATKLKQPEQALILMSHAHMQNAETSDSERNIIIGNEEALSTALFDDVIDYVALGHLHKPQKVGQDHIRYSGSPIPLSFSEINYKHQVLDIYIDPTTKNTTPYTYQVLEIPRAVKLLRIKGELNDVFQQLKQLPLYENLDIDQWHYVEVIYQSDQPPALDLRQRIESALPHHGYRLVRFSREYSTQQLEQHQSKIDLEPPTPQQLFQQLWEKSGFTPNDEVQNDFLSLLHEAEQLQQENNEV